MKTLFIVSFSRRRSHHIERQSTFTDMLVYELQWYIIKGISWKPRWSKVIIYISEGGTIRDEEVVISHLEAIVCLYKPTLALSNLTFKAFVRVYSQCAPIRLKYLRYLFVYTEQSPPSQLLLFGRLYVYTNRSWRSQLSWLRWLSVYTNHSCPSQLSLLRSLSLYTGQRSTSHCIHTEHGLVNSHFEGNCLFINTEVGLDNSHIWGVCLYICKPNFA